MNAMHRSGSAIIICVAFASIAVIVGFAFVRSAGRDEAAGKSEGFAGLARDAARSGLAHATEQILIGYNADRLAVGSGGGTVQVTAPPTFLDGPYRAPFVSLREPGKLAYTQSSEPAAYDDVQEENHVMVPLISRSEPIYSFWRMHHGTFMYDARGRFVEVGYHNVDRGDPGAADPVPVAPLRFTDRAAPRPQRDEGLFMDVDLGRIDDAAPVTEIRRRARYRLRYAVGVEDLGGHLLSNPRADLDADWRSPHAGYRNPPAWVEHAAHVWDNMVSCWGGHRTTALRMAHVFRGRGSATNADRSWPAGPRQGLPATFPMMFRSAVLQNGRGDHWGNFTYNGSAWEAHRHPVNRGGRLFHLAPRDPTWEPIAQNPAGGEILTPYGQKPTKPYVHALLGPQHSWFDQQVAVQGFIPPGDYTDPGGDGDYTSGYEWAGGRSWFMTVPTPFGRRLEASAAAPGTWRWYQGRVDTPWQVNLLTATPQTINEMLVAYLPPHLKDLHYDRDEYYRKTGERPTSDGTGRIEVFSGTIHHVDTNGGHGWDQAIPGLDVLTEYAGGGFSEFPAPASLAADGVTVVSPDYYQDVPDPRPPEDRYPGPLVRGDAATAGQGGDDLGRHVDVDARGIGRCTHTGQPFLYLGGADQVRYTGTDPDRFKVIRRIDTGRFTYKHSYFWDLAYAMTMTLSYVRATWVQYPNPVFDPRGGRAGSGFDPAGLRDPAACDTIEEIDALFLRQLGESWDHPGRPHPEHPLTMTTIPHEGTYRFSVDAQPVSHTIRSLVANDLIASGTVPSIERGKVMERMLNDFRMSFLGSSPRYADFRPFDFDGDGRATCSCYDPNPAASTDEVAYRTARWRPAVNGRGPAPTPLTTALGPRGENPWFSVTGCFAIGKSHFYRIFSRGEVYDNLLRKPVAQQTIESVLCVDPEAPQFPAPGRVAEEIQTLFQRWHYNPIASELPRQKR